MCKHRVVPATDRDPLSSRANSGKEMPVLGLQKLKRRYWFGYKYRVFAPRVVPVLLRSGFVLVRLSCAQLLRAERARHGTCLEGCTASTAPVLPQPGARGVGASFVRDRESINELEVTLVLDRPSLWFARTKQRLPSVSHGKASSSHTRA